MRQTDLQVVCDYLYWLRDRSLNAASRLSRDEFTSPATVTTRDLRGTLVHELDVEWSWRERLRGAPAVTWDESAELKPGDFPSVEALADHWRRDEREMRSWIATLSDEELAAPPPSEDGPLPLWHYVMHLVSHAIQQHADAAVLLTRAGQSPGGIEFLDFASSRQS